jgi:hypothetical protein
VGSRQVGSCQESSRLKSAFTTVATDERQTRYVVSCKSATLTTTSRQADPLTETKDQPPYPLTIQKNQYDKTNKECSVEFSCNPSSTFSFQYFLPLVRCNWLLAIRLEVKWAAVKNAFTPVATGERYHRLDVSCKSATLSTTSRQADPLTETSDQPPYQSTIQTNPYDRTNKEWSF